MGSQEQLTSYTHYILRMLSLLLVIALLFPTACWTDEVDTCESVVPPTIDRSICDDIRSTIFIFRYAVRDIDAKVGIVLMFVLKLLWSKGAKFWQGFVYLQLSVKMCHLSIFNLIVLNLHLCKSFLKRNTIRGHEMKENNLKWFENYKFKRLCNV